MVQFLKNFWDSCTFPIRFYLENAREKKREQELKKKIKELQKRDPFIYK